MNNFPFEIYGKIRRKDTSQGIHGLLVEAWDKDILCDDCLGQDYTNLDGSFCIYFTEKDFKEPFEGYPEVYLLIKDCEGRIIYDTRKDTCTCLPGEPLEFNLELVPDILWWHYSRPLSWECLDEALINDKIIDEIEEALLMIRASSRHSQLNGRE